jgi:hypothetical protein
MERLEALWNGILLRIYKTMLKSAIHCLGAVLELSLHPLDVAEPWTVSKCGKHAGWDEIGNNPPFLFSL